jgi:hypothetical protein
MSNARIFRYFKTSPEIIRLAVVMVGLCQIKNGLADDRIGVVPFDRPVASALPSSEEVSLEAQYSTPNR